jgi:hypothetical protein
MHQSALSDRLEIENRRSALKTGETLTDTPALRPYRCRKDRRP